MFECDSDVLRAVNIFAKKRGFQNIDLEVTDGRIKGDGFIGLITKIALRDTVTNKTMHVIVKGAEKAGEAREAISTHDLFIKETWCYEKLLPVFKKHMNPNSFLNFADFVGACTDDKQEWIIMEDITKRGYSLHRPRLATLDEEYTKASLKGLAQFHALSFVLRDRDSRLYEQLTEKCKDVIFTDEKDPKILFKKFVMQSSANALKLVNKDEPYYGRLKDFCENAFERLTDVTKPTQHSLICHGDYWKNNIMYNFENGTVTSICPLDFQLARHSSPVTDISYLLFNCTSKETRATHYKAFLNYYYKELDSYLKLYNLDVTKLYPRDVFDTELKRVGVYGLGMSMFVLPFLTCADDAILDVNDVLAESVIVDVSKEMFKERMLGVITDCVAYGYI